MQEFRPLQFIVIGCLYDAFCAVEEQITKGLKRFLEEDDCSRIHLLHFYLMSIDKMLQRINQKFTYHSQKQVLLIPV